MGRVVTSKSHLLTVGALAAVLTVWSVPALADVVRVVRFTAASPAQQQAVLKLVDTDIDKLYRTAKGFKSITYMFDPKTLETSSISVWDTEADAKAFADSAGYKPIPEKLKPLMTGPMNVQVLQVHRPTK